MAMWPTAVKGVDQRASLVYSGHTPFMRKPRHALILASPGSSGEHPRTGPRQSPTDVCNGRESGEENHMPLDPQAQQVLKQIAALGLPPNHLVSPSQARINMKSR